MSTRLIRLFGLFQKEFVNADPAGPSATTLFQPVEEHLMQQGNNNNSPSLFDSKTLMAMVAVALVYFGWQSYLSKKYPGYGSTKPIAVPTQTTTPGASGTTAAGTMAPINGNPAIPGTAAATTGTPEVLLPFKNDKISFSLTNHGMGLKDTTVNNYTDKDLKNIKVGTSDKTSLFEMRWLGSTEPIDFTVKEEGPGHYSGVAQVGTMTILRDLKYNPDNSSFENTITFKNPTDQLSRGFELLIADKILTTKSSSFLFRSYEHQDFMVTHENQKRDVVNYSGAKENLDKVFPLAQMLSSGSQYFASVILDKSEIFPEAHLTSNVNDKTALGELIYRPVQLKPEMTFSQILYAGPKSIDILSAVNPEMTQVIDFGFLGMISRPLLYVMKAIHSVIPNWGWSIILLTILVRFCVVPFTLLSMRSMKAMQKVQPILTELKKKHKDDPVRLNQETMAVMKQHGANPVGGCLPMLVQIPVFFALYRVFGNSIELYNAPFALWIQDLSSHDPFYVLPVLMAIFMFIQQKLTPSTMDPTQAKIMAFMPLAFSVFMLQVPSGLALYMVVSGLFGVIQQYLIMRERKAQA